MQHLNAELLLTAGDGKNYTSIKEKEVVVLGCSPTDYNTNLNKQRQQQTSPEKRGYIALEDPDSVESVDTLV